MPAKSIRQRPFTNGSGPSGGGALLGYARVSKGDEQNDAVQTRALKAPQGASPSVRLRMLNRSRSAQPQPVLSEQGFPRLQDGPRALMARGVGCPRRSAEPERVAWLGPVARAVIAPGMAGMRK